MAVSDSFYALRAAWALFGIQTSNVSLVRIYLAEMSGEQDRAQAFALSGAAYRLGMVVGPPIGGIVADISPREVGSVRRRWPC